MAPGGHGTAVDTGEDVLQVVQRGKAGSRGDSGQRQACGPQEVTGRLQPDALDLVQGCAPQRLPEAELEQTRREVQCRGNIVWRNALAGMASDIVLCGGFFCAGHTSRAFWMYQQDNFISAFSYHALMRNDYCNLESPDGEYNPAKITSPRTFTTVLNTTREMGGTAAEEPQGVGAEDPHGRHRGGR